MALLTDTATMANIDTVLRLPGLNFPQGVPVLGKKNINLMIALSAVEVDDGRVGKQTLVVRRLCTLFDAAVSTNEDNATIDINSDRFYAEVLRKVADDHRFMAKYLTPESIRLAIEVYRKAFVRSGWKVIPKPTKKRKQQQMFGYDECADDLASKEGTVGQTTTILEPIEPVEDRVKLEQLVKQWMRARGIARQGGNANKKVALRLKEIDFPQQMPHETLDRYMHRLEREFRQLNRYKHADNHVLSYISDQKAERVAQLSEQNREYEKLLNSRLQLLDMKDDQIDGYKRRLYKNDNRIAEYEALLYQRRECIDKKFEEINDYKIQVTSMQQVIDQYGDMLDNHDDLVSAHAELDNSLTEATKMQAEIMRLEINAANMQDGVNNNLDEVMKGDNEIGQEVWKTIQMQGSVADRQDEVIRRQAQVMARQMGVMDSVRAMLKKYNRS